MPEVGVESMVKVDIQKEIDFKTDSILCVPMKVEDKVIGVIELMNKLNKRRFIKDDLDLVTSLAYQTALVIENARLHIQAQEKIKELSALIGISAIINSSLDLTKILTNIMESATVMLNAEASSIFLIDEQKQELYIEIATGEAKQKIKEIRISMNEGVAGWVAREGKSLLVSDVTKDERFYKKADEKSAFVTKSILAVPLKVKNKTIGVVEVLNKIGGESFRKNDMDLLEALAHQSAIAIDNAMTHKDLKELFKDTLKSLAVAIEEKDPYTRGHVDRLSKYSLALATELGLSSEDQERIYYAAMFHDLGKIGVDETVLKKPGPLTSDEFSEIKKHPEFGKKILEPVKQFRYVIPGILHHQERYDGTGYPASLKGEEISIDGRIIAVVNTFDAMTTDRPYRKAMSYNVAIEELKKYSGTQFDPKVVDAFIKICEKGEIVEKVAYGTL